VPCRYDGLAAYDYGPVGDEREGLWHCTFADKAAADAYLLSVEARVEQLTQERDAARKMFFDEEERKERAEAEVEKLREALTIVLDNAMAHHSGEEGKARALAVISKSARAALAEKEKDE
jgi:hypothetical protein